MPIVVFKSFSAAELPITRGHKHLGMFGVPGIINITASLLYMNYHRHLSIEKQRISLSTDVRSLIFYIKIDAIDESNLDH